MTGPKVIVAVEIGGVYDLSLLLGILILLLVLLCVYFPDLYIRKPLRVDSPPHRGPSQQESQVLRQASLVQTSAPPAPP